MNTITYRKSAVLLRFFIGLGFIIVSILLVLASLFLEATWFRKLLSILAAIAGFWYFGRLWIVMIGLLLKNPILASYDNEQITVNGRSVKRSNLTKLEKVSSVPAGILGIKTTGFLLHTKDEGTIPIPTFYILNEKEEAEIRKTLNKYINERKR